MPLTDAQAERTLKQLRELPVDEVGCKRIYKNVASLAIKDLSSKDDCKRKSAHGFFFGFDSNLEEITRLLGWNVAAIRRDVILHLQKLAIERLKR